MPHATLAILLVVFLATLIRSTFGFGEALFAVPLLALFIPITIAAPLAVLLSITVAAIVVLQDWRHIHFRSALWLLAPTLLGIPLGVALLTRVHPQIVKIVLALIILAFAAYLLLSRTPRHLPSDSRFWLLFCGFFAGLLGGAYGMNGPPLVVYGAMRRWTPQHFRATLQGYFLPASLLGMAGYFFAGLWIPAVTHYYLLSLVVALPAIFLGRLLNRRFASAAFLKHIYLALALTGIVLLLQSMPRI